MYSCKTLRTSPDWSEWILTLQTSSYWSKWSSKCRNDLTHTFNLTNGNLLLCIIKLFVNCVESLKTWSCSIIILPGFVVHGLDVCPEPLDLLAGLGVVPVDGVLRPVLNKSSLVSNSAGRWCSLSSPRLLWWFSVIP